MQLNSTPQCPTFGGSGRTSARTPKTNVQPSGNPLKNELNNSVAPGTPVWITIKEGRTLLGVTERQIRRLIKSGKFKAQTVIGNGGKQYQILLSSLPDSAQVKYWSERLPTPPKVTDEMEIEIAMNRYQCEAEYNRKKADKYTNLLQFCEGKSGSELESAIEVWNKQNPDKKSSYRSVMRMRKDYANKGIDALLGGYGKTKNKSRSIEALGHIGISAYNMFASIYMGDVGQGTPSVNSCWEQTYGYTKKIWAELLEGDVTEFDDIFPCGETFMRALERDKGISTIFLARYGDHAHNQKYGNYVNRDYTNVKAGDVWVSDHRQLDQIWQDKDGTFKRPWVTMWVCFKTQKALSWSIHFDAPRADHVIDTFVTGVEKWGVPKCIYIDNGKDYRSIDFAGGRRNIKITFDEHKTRSLLDRLKVNVKFAQPYNAQTKIIERVFKIHKEWLDKHTKEYTGGNHVERPENLEKYIKQRKIMKFSEGCEIMNFFITNVLDTHASEGKVLLGRSREQAFLEEYTGLPRVSEDSLGILRARNSEVRTIRGNGIREASLHDFYYADWMEGRKGLQVYLRRSMDSMQKAWVFDANTHEFVGVAQLGMWNAPAFAETDLDIQVLREVLSLKNQTRKATKALAKVQDAPSLRERLDNAALAGIQMSDTTPKQSNVTALTDFDDVIRTQERHAATGTDSILFGQPTTTPEQIEVYSIFAT